MIIILQQYESCNNQIYINLQEISKNETSIKFNCINIYLEKRIIRKSLNVL